MPSAVFAMAGNNHEMGDVMTDEKTSLSPPTEIAKDYEGWNPETIKSQLPSIIERAWKAGEASVRAEVLMMMELHIRRENGEDSGKES